MIAMAQIVTENGVKKPILIMKSGKGGIKYTRDKVDFL